MRARRSRPTSWPPRLLGYEDACVFIFDRHEGSSVPVMAFGGNYLHFHTADDSVAGGCELNPFQMDLRRREKPELVDHLVTGPGDAD